MRTKVRIVNPTPNGSEWTGRGRAERYVRSGRAVFVAADAIRFVVDPRNAAATKRAETAVGYDSSSSSGLACLDAIKNLPVAGNPLIVLTRGSSHRARRGRNSVVRILVSNGEQVA